MAVFEYGCDSCGLRQEKLFRKEPPKTLSCSSCGAEAERLISDFGFAFGDGKVPGNTGVDSLDRDHDKRIGRDAEVRWEHVKDRTSRKRKVQREYGDEGQVPLRLNSEGNYEPMPNKDVQRFQRLHKENDRVIREHKKRESESSDQ
jgi:putative FmdB family regulatory protein